MRRVGIILLGILIGCLQLSMHGLSSNVVLPNIALVTVILLLPKWTFHDLVFLTLSIGVVLELVSASSVGTQIIAYLLIVLIGKLLLRQAVDGSQMGFLVALGVCLTLAFNLIVSLALPAQDILQNTQLLLFRTILECVYNGIIIVLGMLFVYSRHVTKPRYRLPRL